MTHTRRRSPAQPLGKLVTGFFRPQFFTHERRQMHSPTPSFLDQRAHEMRDAMSSPSDRGIGSQSPVWSLPASSTNDTNEPDNEPAFSLTLYHCVVKHTMDVLTGTAPPWSSTAPAASTHYFAALRAGRRALGRQLPRQHCGDCAVLTEGRVTHCKCPRCVLTHPAGVPLGET